MKRNVDEYTRRAGVKMGHKWGIMLHLPYSLYGNTVNAFGGFLGS